MTNKLIFIFLMCFSVINAPKAQQTTIIENISRYFGTANSDGLSKYFSSTVQMDIINEEDVYSKVQAEIILKGFFTEHLPSSYNVIHQLNSNASYRFGVLEMITQNGKFRISFSMKETSGKYKITEIRIITI